MNDPTVAEIAGSLDLPPGVVVRAWEADDFPAVRRLSGAEGWSAPAERPGEVLRAWQRSWPALVAVAGDSVVGFLRALSDGGVTAYVAELLVAPDWRGQGIASALLDASHRLCPGSRLDVLAPEASGAFYARNGFRSFLGFRLSWQERKGRPR